MIRYTDEMKEYLKENITGTSYKDITAMFNNRFNTNVSVGAISGSISRYGLKNGIDTRIKKGNTPHNKGKKGVRYAGCEKTWFKKGHCPQVHRPVGSERLSREGYIEIKVAEPSKWRLKHNVIWEDAYGDIPKSSVVIFLDRDKNNLNIDNLKLITRRELLVMNRYNLFSENSKITDTSNVLAKLIVAKQIAKKRAGSSYK